jgi:ribosomal protein L17
VGDLQERVLETIERSRELLDLSAHRLNREEAAVRRVQAHQERQQAEVSRASAETERKLADWAPDPSDLIARGKALRKRAQDAVDAFASNEDEAARLYQDLAARYPERRGQYLREAEHARRAARSARDFLSEIAD